MAECAGIWRDMPKYVFSRTLEHADWNTTIVREVVPEDIRAIKEQSGGDLAVSGAELSVEFMGHDLIDEFISGRLSRVDRTRQSALPRGRPSATASYSCGASVSASTSSNGVVRRCHAR
jgi:dihydrofolate reductase